MSNIIASVTRAGAYEPFDLQVARGQISGHSTVSIFGYQAAVATTYIPVWENAAAYVYPTSASTMTVVSTSVADVSPAAVLINGLDINFNPISETVVLTGQTGVTTVNSYFRINAFAMVGVASGQTSNAGTITIKQSSNTLAQIAIGIGKSQSTIYTVPAGNTLYFDLAEVNTSNSYTSAVIVTYRLLAKNNITGVTSSVLQQPFVAIYTINRSVDPFGFGEKTDLQWQLSTSSSTVAAGVIVTGKLIQNNNNVTGSGT